MKKSISVNQRGSLTLPKRMRHRLGLDIEGGMLVAEETPAGVLLRPATVLPIELYTPERINEFREADSGLAAHLDHLPEDPENKL